MTPYQAEILSIIVRAAQQDGWRVPTGDKLAQLLYDNGISKKDGVNKKISARTANDHIWRLGKAENCFEKRSSSIFIKPEKLTTESQTALFFLLADKMATIDPQGYIPEDRLQRLYILIQAKLNLPPAFERLFKFSCDEKYLEVLETTPGCVRVGPRTKDQQHYLELIAPKWDIDSLIEEVDQ